MSCRGTRRDVEARRLLSRREVVDVDVEATLRVVACKNRKTLARRQQSDVDSARVADPAAAGELRQRGRTSVPLLGNRPPTHRSIAVTRCDEPAIVLRDPGLGARELGRGLEENLAARGLSKHEDSVRVPGPVKHSVRREVLAIGRGVLAGKARHHEISRLRAQNLERALGLETNRDERPQSGVVRESEVEVIDHRVALVIPNFSAGA